MEIKKLLDNGVIGEVKNFSSEMYGPTVLKDSKGTWRGKKKMGGGCMYEFASHCIDYSCLFDRESLKKWLAAFFRAFIHPMSTTWSCRILFTRTESPEL